MNMHLLHHTYITSNTNVSNSGRQNKQLESTSQKALIAQVCHNCTIDCTMPWPWSILRLFSPLCVSAMPNSTSHTDYQQQSSLLRTAQSRTIIFASVIPQEQLRWKIPPNVQRWLAKIFNGCWCWKRFSKWENYCANCLLFESCILPPIWAEKCYSEYWFDHCQKISTSNISITTNSMSTNTNITSNTSRTKKQRCYLSPITRRRSDMSTWPNLTEITFLSFLY